MYYGPSKAGLWYWGSTSINQPVLELVMLHEDSAGAMFWQEYYSGGVIRITIIGTYTAHGWAPVGHGFVIYLFLKTSNVEHKPTIQLLNTLRNMRNM